MCILIGAIFENEGFKSVQEGGAEGFMGRSRRCHLEIGTPSRALVEYRGQGQISHEQNDEICQLSFFISMWMDAPSEMDLNFIFETSIGTNQRNIPLKSDGIVRSSLITRDLVHCHLFPLRYHYLHLLTKYPPKPPHPTHSSQPETPPSRNYYSSPTHTPM